MGLSNSQPDKSPQKRCSPDVRKRNLTDGNRRCTSVCRTNLRNVIKIKHEFMSNDYFIQYPSIGKGSYGEVFKVTHKITGIIRAAKKIQRQMMADQVDMMKEYNILKQLVSFKEIQQHPNIIKMYEIYREDKYNYIVTEYCDGGELFGRLAQEKRFNEPVAAKFMYQILYGVVYCHMKGIIHGDLKPENILLDYTADPTQQVKLADFGASRFKAQKRKMIFGTCLYRAPEVFKNKANQKCDVWSCGIMLYNLVVGALPFKFEKQADDQDEIKRQILNGRVDTKNINYEHTSPAFKNLMKQLTEVDPQRRISAKDALHHEWFIKNVSPIKISDIQIIECLINIREYCRYREIESLSVHYICRFMMDSQQQRRLAPIYKYLDSSLNGVLSKEELIDYLSKNLTNKLTEEDIEELIYRLGNRKDQTITFLCMAIHNVEFMQCCVKKRSILTKSNVEKLFCIIDRKATGKINALLMHQCLGGTLEVHEKMMKKLKESESALLTKSEFVSFVRGV